MNIYKEETYNGVTYPLSTTRDITQLKRGLFEFVRPNKRPQRFVETVAIDIETVDGKGVLFCDSNRRTLWMNKEDTVDKLVEWLHYRGYEGKWILHFNIRYDLNSMIKHFPLEYQKALAVLENAKYPVRPDDPQCRDIRIKFRDKRWYHITFNSKKHVLSAYDVMQFYPVGGLENAVNYYLNPTPEESARLHEDKLGRSKWWKNPPPESERYCTQDAIYTKRLMDLIQGKYSILFNGNMPKPISYASFAQHELKNRCYIPKMHLVDPRVWDYFWRCYHGGRFEIYEIGTVDNAYMLDLNSSYGSAVRNLPNIDNGTWMRVYNMHEGALMGCYKIVVHVHDDIPLLPFVLNDRNKTIIYPDGDFITYVTKPELELLNNYEVIDGWEYRTKKIEYPFRNYIDSMYDYKVNTLDKVEYALFKNMITNPYGKMCQNVGNKMGLLFNPMYASYISALTRIQVWKATNPDNLLAIQTDGIMTRELPKIPISSKIGEWKIEEEAKPLTQFQSGKYRIGKHYAERGAPHIWNNINNCLHKDIITIKGHRVLTLKEAYRGKRMNDLNKFLPITIEEDINGEYKRNYVDHLKDVEDMLTRSIPSMPYDINSLIGFPELY